MRCAMLARFMHGFLVRFRVTQAMLLKLQGKRLGILRCAIESEKIAFLNAQAKSLKLLCKKYVFEACALAPIK